MYLTVKSTVVFWLHLFVTLLAWVAPFLFSWKLSLPVYGLVMLQFGVFGRCLMNEQHGLREEDNRIFYTDLLEKMNFKPDRALVKYLVRKLLYPVLALVALGWQVVWGHAPLLF
jgi:hypothetical protein